jgi:hypothetical protein
MTHFRAPIAVALLGTSLVGCFRTELRQQTHPIRVTTKPEGAWVWQTDKTGKRNLGRAPLTVKRDYQVKVQRFNPWSWIWSGLFAGGTAAGIAMMASDSEDGTTSSGDQVGGILVTTIAGTMLLYALPMCLWGQFKGEQVHPVEEEISVGATLEGHEAGWTKVKVPSDVNAVSIDLAPNATLASNIVAVKGKGRYRIGGVIGKLKVNKPIVAVFNIEDASRALDREVLDQLTEYLSAQMAALGGYRVIPRQQLRQRLSQEKKRGYRACFDEACQIELGKALSAQKTLSTKLLRVGDVCAITAVLYDLKTETAGEAASSETDCSVNALMGGVRKVAEQLRQHRN